MPGVEMSLPGQRPYITHDWGWEEHIVNDVQLNLCHKLLFIKGGFMTPVMRCPRRHKILTCTSGIVMVEYTEKDVFSAAGRATLALDVGYVVRIPADQWYRLNAPKDAYLTEVTNFCAPVDVEERADWHEISGKADWYEISGKRQSPPGWAIKLGDVPSD